MKKLYYLAVELMMAGASLAQDVPHVSRVFAGISMGPATLIGNFGDKDLLNEKSGLVVIGLNIILCFHQWRCVLFI
jgi:hypothetical protein